ncbi:MAG: hypothetical protein ACR2QU_06100 [Gammaproteobacteria bacterium]
MTLMETAQLLGNFGEFFGAIAVVTTLGYLAIQIRQSTERERLGQEFNSNQYFNQLRNLVASDQELADIEMRGLGDLASLTALERHRFDELQLSWVWAIHKAFQQYKALELATNWSDGSGPLIRRRFCGAGFRDWWSENRGEITDVEFREAMDTALSSATGQE